MDDAVVDPVDARQDHIQDCRDTPRQPNRIQVIDWSTCPFCGRAFDAILDGDG